MATQSTHPASAQGERGEAGCWLAVVGCWAGLDGRGEEGPGGIPDLWPVAVAYCRPSETLTSDSAFLRRIFGLETASRPSRTLLALSRGPDERHITASHTSFPGKPPARRGISPDSAGHYHGPQRGYCRKIAVIIQLFAQLTASLDMPKKTSEAVVTHQSELEIDPTAPISPSGLPMVQQSWVKGRSIEKVSEMFYGWVLTSIDRLAPKGAGWPCGVHRLPQDWRAIFTVCWLQAEVDNGGFDQFFYNGKGDLDDVTEADLLYIGADVFHRLFAEARHLYYAAPVHREGRLDKLERLDDEFYSQPKTPYHLIGERILSHRSIYFCD